MARCFNRRRIKIPHSYTIDEAARRSAGNIQRERFPMSPRFRGIQRASLPSLNTLVPSWLPNGRREGDEWLAFNPRRADRRLGSFKINLRTGQWADFAVGEKGGDAISLLAYLRGLSQSEAARVLAQELRVRL